VLAKRGTWEGNVQRFVDHLMPPLVTNSSGDNKRTFRLYYLLYTHVHAYIHTNTIILCFWLWRFFFLLTSKLRLWFSLSTFTIGFPVLLLDPRRIH
jgi:hypothetical protein